MFRLGSIHEKQFNKSGRQKDKVKYKVKDQEDVDN